MQLAQVVFFGRLGSQALAMFNLDPAQWRGARVLDCPGGPGSLSALLRADLEAAMATLATSSAIRPDFNLDACRQEHLEALAAFLADRHAHRERYLAASLPNLPFADQSFDLVLSGHLLFSYAPCSAGGLMEKPGLDLDWHRSALHELLRVSRRAVHLYPAHTMELQARRHPYAEALLAELPASWHGRFATTSYDQGHEGLTDALELKCQLGPVPT